MAEPGGRAERVGERVRAELAEVMMRGGVRDPGARDVIISAVRMSPDLSVARVYIRILGDADDRRQERAVDAMNRASGYLRREIGTKLTMRVTPELRFDWDDAVDHGLRIERLLADIGSEGEGA